jgi:predicted nucleic acid-binding protein
LIAADTSSLIAYLAGLDGPDIDQIELAIATDQLRIPPPVISEMLTQGSADVEHLLATVPKLPIDDGFWERAGRSRALVRSQGFKANLPDTLIAQCCIDAGAGLIARDRDYSHFAEFCGLTLAV